MKKLILSIACICLCMIAFGQSNLILPQGAAYGTPGHILKTAVNVQGYSHTNGTVGIGTYIEGTSAYLQTHTPHSLNFGVNNSVASMTIRYSATGSLNGNVGINTFDPVEKLHVVGNIRTTSLAGVGKRNVYADANGKLTSGSETQTLVVTPQSFQRRNNTGEGRFVSSGNYSNAYMFGAGATDNIVSSFTLPVGATVTGISVYFTDNDPNNNLEIAVIKSTLSSSAFASITATFFQNTINANDSDVTTLSSGTLAETVATNEYFEIVVQPRLLTAASIGVWNYTGGNTNFMSVKGLKVTYTL